jgi:hypothetical protein
VKKKYSEVVALQFENVKKLKESKAPAVQQLGGHLASINHVNHHIVY